MLNFFSNIIDAVLLGKRSIRHIGVILKHTCTLHNTRVGGEHTQYILKMVIIMKHKRAAGR